MKRKPLFGLRRVWSPRAMLTGYPSGLWPWHRCFDVYVLRHAYCVFLTWNPSQWTFKRDEDFFRGWDFGPFTVITTR